MILMVDEVVNNNDGSMKSDDDICKPGDLVTNMVKN